MITEVKKGVFIFPQALSWLEQKTLIKLYKNMQADMYVPELKSGFKMNLKMNCLGSHWSAKDYKYYSIREDVDKQPIKTVDPLLINLAAKFNKLCFPEHDSDWNIAICNYYKTNSTLGVHQDNSESKETLNSGHPVVSFSVGASCNFKIGGLYRKDPTQDIILQSGDVLIFGNESRLIYHGISKMINNQNKYLNSKIPFEKSLDSGRINFTLRKM